VNKTDEMASQYYHATSNTRLTKMDHLSASQQPHTHTERTTHKPHNQHVPVLVQQGLHGAHPAEQRAEAVVVVALQEEVGDADEAALLQQLLCAGEVREMGELRCVQNK
jgi:hypothetical protein